MSASRSTGCTLRSLALAVVPALLLVSALSPGVLATSSGPLVFSTTQDFDAGSKGPATDGVYGVETSTDNPGIASDRFELGSLKGDAFGVPDADADTFKWDVPSTCTIRSPTTIVRSISGGELHLGSNRSTGSTRVGVVSAGGLLGDVEVSVRVTEVSVQDDSRFSLQLLNEPRCYYSATPKTADGVEFEVDKSLSSNNYLLKPFAVRNGTETLCASGTHLAETSFLLRITRSGTSWLFSHSLDGIAWTVDSACSLVVSGPLYTSLVEKDPKGVRVTEYALDEFRVSAGTPAPGGFLTSGTWTSPAFDVPLGQILDRVEVAGTFDATYALDRLEILQGGSVVEASEADNVLTLTPASQVTGADVRLRLTLRGDGAGTPAVTRVEASFRAAFPVTGETVLLGTSTGILNMTASDDAYDVKTEALGPVSSVETVDAETIVAGSKVSGVSPPSPSDLDASDDASLVYTEANEPTFEDTPPDALVMPEGTLDVGTFPGCGAADDGDACTFREAGTTSETAFGPTSATIGLGSQASGVFPDDLVSSDDASVEYREGDAGVLQTFYVPASQAVLKGVEGSGLPYAQGTFTRKTDGPGVQRVSGVGLHGKALILWWTRQIAFGTRIHNSAGIGLVSSPTEQQAIAWADDDARSPSNAGRRSAAAAVTILLNGTPALDGQASFLGFTEDGFEFEWTTNPSPAEATIIHYVVLGNVVSRAYVGQFAGPPAGATGLRSYGGVGFQGNLAIFMGTLQTSLGDARHATMGFGAASGPLNRASVSIEIPDGTTNADTEIVHDNRRALMMYNPVLSEPTTDQLMDFVSFTPDGFTLNHVKATSGNILFWGLVLQGGSYNVNAFLRQTTLGDQAISGLGFRPNGVLFFGGSSYLAYGSEDSGAEFILGAGSATAAGEKNTVTWAGSNDAVNPTNANQHTSDAYVIRDLSLSSQSAQNQATYKASDPDGFRVTWTQIQSGSGQKWFYIAFGGEAAGNPFPGCLAASDDARCLYSETLQGDTGDYRAEVRYDWTGVETTGTEWRLFVEGRTGASNPEAIDVRVYGSDDVTLSPAACAIVSGTDAGYDCGTLTADQLDGGAPNILLSDAVRSPDGSPSSFEVDQVYIRRLASTQALDVRHDWGGVPTDGTSYGLRVEGRVDGDAVLVQVLTPPATWTTRVTLSSTSDASFAYALSLEEFNGGSPAVRFVDANPADVVPSSLWLDRVVVVRAYTTYALAMEWDWTASIDLAISASLVVRASISGDAEGLRAEVYDWQDDAWRAAFTISSAVESEYAAPMATECTEEPGDCEVSAALAGSVRLRFTDLDFSDTSRTSLHIDLAAVRVESAGYVVTVEYTFVAMGGRSGEDALRVEGNRSDEDILVQVWDWTASAWLTRIVLSATVDTAHVHALEASEISDTFDIRVRFIGANEVADPVPSDFSVDHVAIEKREYRLDIVDAIAGLSGPGPFVLHLEARSAGLGDVDVWLYNWTDGSWILWLDSSISGVDQTFDHILSSDEIGTGETRVRFRDGASVNDDSASTLFVDFLGVS